MPLPSRNQFLNTLLQKPHKCSGSGVRLTGKRLGVGAETVCAQGVRPLYYSRMSMDAKVGIAAQDGVVSSNSRLSGGAIAGIIIGCVAFVILCAATACCIFRRKAALQVLCMAIAIHQRDHAALT